MTMYTHEQVVDTILALLTSKIGPWDTLTDATCRECENHKGGRLCGDDEPCWQQGLDLPARVELWLGRMERDAAIPQRDCKTCRDNTGRVEETCIGCIGVELVSVYVHTRKNWERRQEREKEVGV